MDLVVCNKDVGFEIKQIYRFVVMNVKCNIISTSLFTSISHPEKMIMLRSI